MTFADRIARADDFLLDRVFQPVADRCQGRPTAFDLGMSLEIGSVVFLLAADIALFAAGQLGWLGAVWDGLCCGCGAWFYRVMLQWRGMVREGRPNPLRPLYRPVRVLTIAYTAYSFWLVAVVDREGRLSAVFNSASNLAFLVGLYLISCQPRPPVRRRAPEASPWQVLAPGQ
jgi:hypothetical protein